METFNPDILFGKICPYCHKTPKLIDSKEIYGQSYGLVHYCSDCHAWVGCHPGTNKPLGRLASGSLRYWKKQAHYYFDGLWRKKAKIEGISKNKARQMGYKWLSKELNIPPRFTHIGMFDVNVCKQVVKLCQPYFK